MFARRRWFIFFLLFSLLALESMLFALVDSYQRQQASAKQVKALQNLSTARARLEGLLNANLISMRGLRAEFMANPDTDQQRFARFSRYLLGDGLHTRHVAAAPDLVIRFIYPLEGNETVLNTDYRDLPEQLTSVEQAIATGDVIFQGPLELLQGSTALIARVPVIDDDGSVWGVISQIIDEQSLFNDAGLNEHGSLQLALRDSSHHLAGHASVWEHDYVSLNMQLGNLDWVLAGYPAQGYWAPPWWQQGWLLVAGNLVIFSILALFMVIFINHLRLQGAFSKISEQAQKDPLTGLVNRSHLVQLVSQYIYTMGAEAKHFSVLFIDLDYFKEVNDSFGHGVGDKLLLQVAQRLQQRLRQQDIVSRLGGDEFVAVLKDVADRTTVSKLAEQLQAAIAKPFDVEGKKLEVQASIGIARYPHDGTDVTTLIKNADTAMYQAKANGRNNSAFYS